MTLLQAFAEEVSARRPAWESAGFVVQVLRGKETPKPAAWVIIEGSRAVGQLTLWVSGECDTEVARVRDGAAVVLTTAVLALDDVGPALDKFFAAASAL